MYPELPFPTFVIGNPESFSSFQGLLGREPVQEFLNGTSSGFSTVENYFSHELC